MSWHRSAGASVECLSTKPNFTRSVTQVIGFPRLLDRGLTTAEVSTRADRRRAAGSGSEWRAGSWCERWPSNSPFQDCSFDDLHLGTSCGSPTLGPFELPPSH